MFTRKDRHRKAIKFKKMEELVLPNAKLKFCDDQLQNLNFIFNKRLEKSESMDSLSVEKSIALAKSVTERLIQRLLCGAAMIDPRFACKYLINNRIDQHDTNNTHLEYIVRLDALSTPLLYDTDDSPTYEVLENDKDCPAGYARIRLGSSTYKEWEEFINSFGFLRRDRIQAKLVELLAQAASNDQPSSPLHVDESIMCGVPGKVLDPATLYHVLKIPSNRQIFYGPGGNVPRFPDTRDFRLAIVDEPNGIKVNVEFLSPALSSISMKVSMLVGVGVDAWPASCDFPSRIALGHSDCLLHHQAAQTAMFLVGYGVHSSAWQLRVPAAEFILLNHYGPNSTVRTILDVLYDILHDINSLRKFQKPMSYKILNRYMLFTLLMEELEENSVNPFADMVNWSPMFLSRLVLRLLDKAILRLSLEFQPNYFFKKTNLLVNPGHLCDDDFIIEANNVKNFMIRLFDESLMSNRGNDEFTTMLISQESEFNLLYRWKSLVEGMIPPAGTRARRLCFAGSKNKRDMAYTQYTARQLEYIGLVLQNMLRVRQNVLNLSYQNLDESGSASYQEDHALDDVVFILVAFIDQARDQYLSLQNPTVNRNRAKIKATYGEYMSKLVDLVRKDKDIKNCTDLHDDQLLVKIILKWLYKAMDQNKKFFSPMLRPYLNNIFCSSYHVSYHLEPIKRRMKNDELEALGSFCYLVNDGDMTPAQGLMDSINKNWQWARDMMEMVERNTLRLIFVQNRGKVYKHILSLPSYTHNADGSKTWTDKERKVKSIRTKTTLPGRNYFNSLLIDGQNTVDIPQHEILKSNSPLTLILSKRHRSGEHRCAGDLLKAMATMHKLSVFQDATSSLPKEEQTRLMNIVDNIHTNRAKKSLAKKWSNTLPHSSKIGPVGDFIQRYTPKEESAGLQLSQRQSSRKPLLRNESLLGTSRAARLKEDNRVFLSQDNLKNKGLLDRTDPVRL